MRPGMIAASAMAALLVMACEGQPPTVPVAQNEQVRETGAAVPAAAMAAPTGQPAPVAVRTPSVGAAVEAPPPMPTEVSPPSSLREIRRASAVRPPSPAPPTQVAPAAGVSPSVAATAIAPAGHCPVALNRATTARGVEHREPVGAGQRFPANNRVYVFMEVNNATGNDRQLTIRWQNLENNQVFTQTVEVGVSPSWRTWVYHTIQPTERGTWKVEILASGGCEVGELRFEAT